MQPLEGPPENEAIRRLVAECLDAMELRGPAALDELCARHPESAAQLRRRVESLGEVGLLAAGPTLDEIPARLGDYELLARLGSGGMGVVYRARQRSLGREVALKLIRPDQLYFPGARERFWREVESVAALRHPGIVPIHAVGEEAGLPYYAMDLVPGCSLAQAIESFAGRETRTLSGADLARRARGTVEADGAWGLEGSWTTVGLKIGVQAAEALAHAHHAGVLHRDVKPSNLMITPGGRVVLLDFGLARRAGNPRLTRTGSELGSLPYMAPEQLAGARAELGPAVDVYGLGVTLCELLTLRSPFPDGEPESTRRAILEGHTPRLGALDSAVRWEVETVLAKATDLDPARRYPTAEALARDLRNVLAGRSIEARRAGASRQLARGVRKHPALAVGLTLGGLMLVGGPILYALQESRARARVEAALAKAEEQRRVAQAERESAERDFQRALGAVRTLLAQVGAQRLQDLPRVQGLRVELLQQALELYDAFVEERPLDSALRRERALQRASLAQVQAGLSRFDDALEATRRSRAELEPILEQGPADELVAHTIAVMLEVEAEILESQRRAAAAEAAWRRGLDFLGRTATSPRLVRDRAAILSGMGRRARGAGDATAAEQHLQAALREFAAAGTPSEDAGALEAEARTWNELAQLQRDSGRTDDALAAHARARALREACVRMDPDDSQARAYLGQTLGNMGFLELAERRSEQAQATLRSGYEMFEALAREHPELPIHRYGMVAVGSNLAAALVDLGRDDEAERVLARCHELATALQAEFPDVGEYANLRAGMSVAVAERDVARGDWDAARSDLDQARALLLPLLAQRPRDPTLLFQRAKLVLADARRLLGVREAGHALEVLRELPAGPYAQERDALRRRIELLAGCALQGLDDERLSEFDREERIALCAIELGASLERLRAIGEDPFEGLSGVPGMELLADHEELPTELRSSSR